MYEQASNTDFDEVEVAMMSSALFDLYDEPERMDAANDEMYDNMYPMPA